MIATVLCLSVLPTVLCAFAFVYGLVFCIQSLINGEKMSESKHCRNMFLNENGALRSCQKVILFDKGAAVCCAHNLSAGGAQISHLQPERYFLRRTCRRRK